MLTPGLMLFTLAAQQPPQAAQRPTQPEIQTVMAIAQSGRCTTVAESPDERVVDRKQVPPGKPPLLSFRLYEAKAHHENTSGLMLDDAGH
jgi:hypothetical protein